MHSRGIAVELGAAGATVYVTGRTTWTQREGIHKCGLGWVVDPVAREWVASAEVERVKIDSPH